MWSMDTTTIEVTKEDWRRLNARKWPGDGMKDVVTRVLDRLEEHGDARPADAAAGAGEAVPPAIEGAGGASSGRNPRVRGALSGIEVPGSGETADARREALLEMWETLRADRAAAKKDLLAVVDPDDVDYQSRESFWSNCIKGRDTLRALPGVEPPDEGMHLWRFDPDAASKAAVAGTPGESPPESARWASRATDLSDGEG